MTTTNKVALNEKGKITVDGKQIAFGNAKRINEDGRFFATTEYSLVCNIGLAMQLEAGLPTSLEVASVERTEDESKIYYEFLPFSETALRLGYGKIKVYLMKGGN